MRTLHVGLRVADVGRSLAWYQAVGYEVVGRAAGTAHGGLTMLKLPDDEFVTVELVHDPTRPVSGSGGLNHVVIQVEDMAATVAELPAKGVEPEEPASPDGSADFWTAWLTTPDGHRIELVQWHDGHPAGMTGADFMGPADG